MLVLHARPGGLLAVIGRAASPSEKTARANIVPQVRDEINRPSNKLSRAGTYGVPVVSERRFLEWIGKAVPDSWHRTYSADQIAALSKLSSGTVNELVRFGLLDPREVVCSGFAIWQVLGRSQVCLRMGLDCLRSFAA